MSRSRMLAGLFLALGTADLVLLNGWLVPAAWPPSSEPPGTATASAPARQTTEIASTATQGHAAALTARGETPAESVVGDPPRSTPMIVSNLPLAKPQPEREASGTVEPPGDGLLAMEPTSDSEVELASIDAETVSAQKLEPAAELPGEGLLAAAKQDAEPPSDSGDASDSVDGIGPAAQQPEPDAEQPGEGLLATTQQNTGLPMDSGGASASIDGEVQAAQQPERATELPSEGHLAVAQQHAEAPADSGVVSASVESPGTPGQEFGRAEEGESAEFLAAATRTVEAQSGTGVASGLVDGEAQPEQEPD